MSLAILFHFSCAQHVSDINISIIRSLQLFCWITTLVVLFLFRCVDILLSEIYWEYKKWNKIASDIKFVFYSSTLIMMHGPINIRIETCCPNTIINIIKFYCVWLMHHCVFIYFMGPYFAIFSTCSQFSVICFKSL